MQEYGSEGYKAKREAKKDLVEVVGSDMKGVVTLACVNDLDHHAWNRKIVGYVLTQVPVELSWASYQDEWL